MKEKKRKWKRSRLLIFCFQNIRKFKLLIAAKLFRFAEDRDNFFIVTANLPKNENGTTGKMIFCLHLLCNSLIPTEPPLGITPQWKRYL